MTHKKPVCLPVVVIKYPKRIRGPILDRIEIHIEVTRVDYEPLNDWIGEAYESIDAVCKRRAIFNKKQLDDIIIKLSDLAVPTGLGFATRNYLGA